MAKKQLDGLIISFNELCQNRTIILSAATKITANLVLKPTFIERRTRRRRHIYSDRSDETMLSPGQTFNAEYFYNLI